MSKIRHSVILHGAFKTWSVTTYITRETAADWRADGITVYEVENTIPLWVADLGPVAVQVWCTLQDWFNFKWRRE